MGIGHTGEPRVMLSEQNIDIKNRTTPYPSNKANDNWPQQVTWCNTHSYHDLSHPAIFLDCPPVACSHHWNDPHTIKKDNVTIVVLQLSVSKCLRGIK